MKVRLKEMHRNESGIYDLNMDTTYEVLQNRSNLMYCIKSESGRTQLYPTSLFIIDDRA